MILNLSNATMHVNERLQPLIWLPRRWTRSREFLDWNSLDKTFYLLDTFSGIDERFVNDEEKLLGRLEINKKVLDQGGYELDVESAWCVYVVR